MYNHLRTLLMNMPDRGDTSEHIPKNFKTIKLNSNLSKFYDILYPANSSRFYKLFLTHNYLSIIEAAGLNYAVVAMDPRITYDLADDTQFFKFSRTTNPIVSNPNFSLLVTGDYQNNVQNNDFYDNILISQVTNTAAVDVYSKVNDKYYTQNKALTFSLAGFAGASTVVPIGTTGLSFQIIALSNFTSTATKTWEFIAEAPFEFNFSALYNHLVDSNIVEAMLSEPTDNKMFDNLWSNHYNPIYKVAGLLLAYVHRIKI